MRIFAALIACLILLPLEASGQTPVPDSTNQAQGKTSPKWTYTPAVAVYFIPDSDDIVDPTFSADHGRFHFEARYNYEAVRTGSLWVGFNIKAGKEFEFALTPMVSGVFGKLNGIAPGFNLSLSYKRISLYSQSEYVFDLEESSGNFFYAWNELAYSPLAWLRAGMAAQRTRAYQTELSVQRGPFASLTVKRMTFGTYVFNLGWTDPTVVVTFNIGF